MSTFERTHSGLLGGGPGGKTERTIRSSQVDKVKTLSIHKHPAWVRFSLVNSTAQPTMGTNLTSEHRSLNTDLLGATRVVWYLRKFTHCHIKDCDLQALKTKSLMWLKPTVK